MTIVRGLNNQIPVSVDGDLTEDLQIGDNNFAPIRITGDCRASISFGANNSGTFSLDGSNFGRIDFGANNLGQCNVDGDVGQLNFGPNNLGAPSLSAASEAGASQPQPQQPPSEMGLTLIEIVRESIRLDSQGESVQFLQRILNAKLWYELKVDGVWGAGTQDAVIEFQTARGLDPDGVFGRESWSELLGDRPILTNGDEGPDVLFLQNAINDRPVQTPYLPIPEIATDGVYGDETVAAVREVQGRAGINVDGTVGPDTWQVIEGIFPNSWTERVLMNVRVGPGTSENKITKLPAKKLIVDILSRRLNEDEEREWYQVRFKEHVDDKLRRGTVAWVSSIAIKSGALALF